MDCSITRVTLWSFIEWFEIKLNDRYDMSLQGLKLRFFKFYNIIRSILNYTAELNDLLSEDLLDSSTVHAKPLLDNCLNIIKLIIQEYPNCLDLEFCEGFLATIREKLDLFNANFHPILHVETPDSKLNKKIISYCDKINNAMHTTGDAISEIEKRASLAVPILKSIEDSLSIFRDQIKKLSDEIKALKSNNIFFEYQAIFNEFMGHIQKDQVTDKGDNLKKNDTIDKRNMRESTTAGNDTRHPN